MTEVSHTLPERLMLHVAPKARSSRWHASLSNLNSGSRVRELACSPTAGIWMSLHSWQQQRALAHRVLDERPHSKRPRRLQ
jgi:hypothetical protein